jgi:hypothetical protein
MLLRLAGAAALVAATAFSAATPAAAQGYRYSDDCTRRIHDNGTTGAIVGGIAGAVVGSNLAHGGGRTGGAILGGAAGAAIGNNIARSSTKDGCRGRRYYSSGYYVPPPPPPPPPRPVYVEPAPVYVERVYEPVYVVKEPHGHAYGHWKHHHHDDDDDD